jgi:hypothetical protein
MVVHSDLTPSLVGKVRFARHPGVTCPDFMPLNNRDARVISHRGCRSAFDLIYCAPVVASDIIARAWSMVKLFGFCTAGKSLNVAAHLSEIAYAPNKM